MRRSLGLWALLVALGVAQPGCAGSGPAVSVTPESVASTAPNGSVKGYLYVSNRPPTVYYTSSKIKCATWISVYRAGTPDLVEKLPGLCKGRDGNGALAFDGEDNAYWADDFNGAVLVFAPHEAKPYTIAWGASAAYSLGVDGSGRLYVANVGPGVIGYGQSSVSVYAHGKKIPSYKITQGITFPSYLTVSTSGELFVANCPPCFYQYYGYSGTSTVAVYSAGEKAPSRELSAGIDAPVALALDTAGDLYVANMCATESCTHGSVTVYTPKAKTPSLTITQGFSTPYALTVGSDGTLYVAGSNDVVEFAKGEKTPETTIPIDGCKPTALTLDSANNLYVMLAQCGSGSKTPLGAVAVYAPKRTKPAYTITKGIDEPKNSFAIAP
jgi:hypothetical protein